MAPYYPSSEAQFSARVPRSPAGFCGVTEPAPEQIDFCPRSALLAMSWQLIPLSTASDVVELDALASGYFKDVGKRPYFQDVYWLLSWAKGKPEEVRLYANFLDGRISGIAGGIVEDCQIRIGFGSRLRLHTFRLKRLRLQEPLLCSREQEI